MFSVGAVLPSYGSVDELPGVEDSSVRPTHDLAHALTFAPDSRMVEAATLAFTTVDDATRHELHLAPIFTHRMKGIGYSHPEWGHGVWKDELALESERWTLAEVDDTAYENQHVQHLVRARMGDRVGIGVLEQNILGAYEPYGLRGALDPPTGRS